MNKLLSLLFISIVLLSTSCSDKEDGDVEGILMTVSPSAGTVKKINERVKFTCQVNSEAEIQTFLIVRQAQNELKIDTVVIEKPGTKKYFKQIEFLVEYPPAGSNYFEYTFIVVDVEGNRKSLFSRVSVESTPLTPLEGILLYSSISTEEQGGYNLKERKVVASDSTLAGVAFLEATDTTGNPSKMLSNKWIGVSGTQFLKSATFKYEDATLESVRQAMEINTTTNQVGTIKANDKILIKYKKSNTEFGYVVILINSVTDIDGADSDVYNFNLKYVKI